MAQCSDPTGVAHFKGRKNQSHDGQYCLVSCEVARRSSKIPLPNRCIKGR